MILAEVLPENTEYVLAAYMVFFAMLLIYFVIMAARLARVERELVELNSEPDSGTEAERTDA